MAIIEYSLDLADLGAKRARERRVAVFVVFFKSVWTPLPSQFVVKSRSFLLGTRTNNVSSLEYRATCRFGP